MPCMRKEKSGRIVCTDRNERMEHRMAKGFFDEDITENLNNPPKHIRGLVCSVKNCEYHDSEGFCTANTINVGPGYAESCTDTVCATFKARK